MTKEGVSSHKILQHYCRFFDEEGSSELVNQKAIKGCHVPAHPIQRYRIQVNGDKISDPDYPTSSYTILHV